MRVVWRERWRHIFYAAQRRMCESVLLDLQTTKRGPKPCFQVLSGLEVPGKFFEKSIEVVTRSSLRQGRSQGARWIAWTLACPALTLHCPPVDEQLCFHPPEFFPSSPMARLRQNEGRSVRVRVVWQERRRHIFYAAQRRMCESVVLDLQTTRGGPKPCFQVLSGLEVPGKFFEKSIEVVTRSSRRQWRSQGVAKG